MTDPATPAPDQLTALRAEIDALDDALLEMIGARAGFAGKIIAAKGADSAPTPMRPAREVQMLRRLLAKAPEGVDQALIMEIWRALIAANLRRQKPIEAIVAGPGESGGRLFDVARSHFGASVKVTRADDPRVALTRVVEGEPVVAVAAWPGGGAGPGAWWPMLNETRFKPLMIVGALPMVADAEHQEPEAAMVALGLPLEPAGGDGGFAIAYDVHYRAARALADAGLPGKEVARARETVLIRFREFVAPNDARIPLLAQAGLDGFRVVGSFARV